jgi:hypothetical protein
VGVVQIDVESGDVFEFQLPGSKKVWRLPSMDDLPVGMRQSLADVAKPIQAAKDGGREPPRAALEAFGLAQIRMLEKLAPGLLDLASASASAAVLRAWAEHSGIDLGESPASAS